MTEEAAIITEAEAGVVISPDEVQIIDNEAAYLELEAAGEQVDIASPYETELVISSLTMSDLDELRPYLIDDMIIKAAAGELEGISELEVANLITMKV